LLGPDGAQAVSLSDDYPVTPIARCDEKSIQLATRLITNEIIIHASSATGSRDRRKTDRIVLSRGEPSFPETSVQRKTRLERLLASDA
jgi:hypothetical protein